MQYSIGRQFCEDNHERLSREVRLLMHNLELVGNPGEPVAPVDPVDLKRVCDSYRDAEERSPGQQFALGLGPLARTFSPRTEVKAAAYRYMMLRLALRHASSELAPWYRDDQPDDSLFRAFAEFPLQWMAVGVPRQG